MTSFEERHPGLQRKKLSVEGWEWDICYVKKPGEMYEEFEGDSDALYSEKDVDATQIDKTVLQNVINRLKKSTEEGNLILYGALCRVEIELRKELGL